MKASEKWKRASLSAAVILALYTVAASARADSMIVNSIGGDTNSFLGNFSMNWTAFGPGHSDGRRFIVRSDELLSAFLELEATLL
jgi:hypothetical protein